MVLGEETPLANEACNAMVRSLALTFGSAKPVCATAVGSFDGPHPLAAASVSHIATAARMPNYRTLLARRHSYRGGDAPARRGPHGSAMACPELYASLRRRCGSLIPPPAHLP